MTPVNDLRLRYNHTVIKVLSKKDSLSFPVYVEEFHEDDFGRQYIHYIKEESDKIVVEPLINLIIQPRISSRCFESSGGEVKIFRWSSARQQKRGLSRGNCICEGVLLDRIMEGLSHDHSIQRNDHPWLGKITDHYRVLEQNYSNSLDKARKALLEEPVFSKVVSEVFWISLSDRDDEQILWYLSAQIGVIQHNKIKIINSLFEQEIRDFINRIGEFYYVV